MLYVLVHSYLRTDTYGMHRTGFACFSLLVLLYSYLPLTAAAAVCILYAKLYFTAAMQYRVDPVRVPLDEYSTAL